MWSTRLTSLANTSQRYSKPWFERIWLVVGFLASIIVPGVLYNVIYNNMNVRDVDGGIDLNRLAEVGLGMLDVVQFTDFLSFLESSKSPFFITSFPRL